MIGILIRSAGLLAIYLLVLTSVHPGDVVIGGAVALAITVGLGSTARRGSTSRGRWLRGLVGTALQTVGEVAVGSWRTIRFCLQGGGTPGFVEVPRGDRSDYGVALWGVLTGEAPDQYPVAFDAERRVMLVHLVDASDPAAVRERHRRSHERWHRDVVA